MQGNPRKLGVSGEDASFVQYTLDDPDEFNSETIVIVGAGDAAIENAIALARNNSVIIVNRRDEFARAKEGNLSLITRAIDAGSIPCFYNCNVASIDTGEAIVLNTETGQTRVPCDRVIARLGAIAPRRFVESCGIEFPSDDPTTLPELSNRYESNVHGLYVIGALGGYPLIKQAMNQGFEVAEFVAGNDVQPADHGILEQRRVEVQQRETPRGMCIPRIGGQRAEHDDREPDHLGAARKALAAGDRELLEVVHEAHGRQATEQAEQKIRRQLLPGPLELVIEVGECGIEAMLSGVLLDYVGYHAGDYDWR